MSGERPSHKCFVVEDREGGNGKEAFWLPIGAAWPHKDGKGFNLQLSALPANGGRIVLREVVGEEERARAGGADSESQRVDDLARVAGAGRGDPFLQMAEDVLRTGVAEAMAGARKGKRKSAGAA
jgi:hypothetical protein